MQRFFSTTTHFGFKTVPTPLKETLVAKVFSNVASNYDNMNDAMSLGIHRIWKDHLIRTIAPSPTSTLLDVAGGTGDIAFRFLNYLSSVHHNNKSTKVTVLDINEDMLNVGRERAKSLGYTDISGHQLDFQQGNAQDLINIKNNSVDCYTIAFGIRNCTDVDKVLQEAFRVLKPGGRFTCLEFSRVDNAILRSFYDQYSFTVIPALGEAIASDRSSYQYLVESIRKFPPQPQFSQMIRDAGFTLIGDGWENLTFGVAAIHTGWKI